MSRYTQLVDGISSNVIGHIKGLATEEKWNLIGAAGQHDVATAARLLIECSLAEASGRDCSIAKTALVAVLKNWETVAWIKVDGLVDDFIDKLKGWLIEAGSVALKIAIAAI